MSGQSAGTMGAGEPRQSVPTCLMHLSPLNTLDSRKKEVQQNRVAQPPLRSRKHPRRVSAGYKCQGEHPTRQTNGLQWARQTAGNHRRTSRSILVR